MSDERIKVLQKGIELTSKDRNTTYNQRGSFVSNMELQAEFVALYKKFAGDNYTPAHDNAIFHVLGKIARIAQGALHEDNYVDGAVYLGAAFECEINRRSYSDKGLDYFNGKVPLPTWDPNKNNEQGAPVGKMEY